MSRDFWKSKTPPQKADDKLKARQKAVRAEEEHLEIDAEEANYQLQKMNREFFHEDMAKQPKPKIDASKYQAKADNTRVKPKKKKN